MKLLYNPFEKIPEYKLFITGIMALISGSLLAWLLHCRFSALLNIYPTTPAPRLWQPLADNAIIIGIVAALLMILGLLANRRTRLIDVLNASLIARIPFYLIPLSNINNFLAQAIPSAPPESISEIHLAGSDYTLLSAIAFVIIGLVAWSMALLHNGFKVATHYKSTWFTILFVIAIIAANVLSGILISSIT